MSAPTSTTSNNVTLIALVFLQSGYLQRRSFECAMSTGSEASICLSDFSLKEVQFCWQETFSRRDTSANESVHSLCVAIPRLVNKNPSRPHQWQRRLLLRTSLLSDLIAQSSTFKGKRPLTSDIKGAHQRACDQDGTAQGGTTFGSALIPF